MFVIKDESLKLEKQLCFPLYAAAKEVTRLYTPFLKQLDLTYTQYIAMMLIWEKQEFAVKELALRLFLDTGTLTPLLKKLESKGLISLSQNEQDHRSVMINITKKGIALYNKALDIPNQIKNCIPLDEHELTELYRLTYKILNTIQTK